MRITAKPWQLAPLATGSHGCDFGPASWYREQGSNALHHVG